MKPAPATVDEYLAGVTPSSACETLAGLRAIIRDELPEAVESIKYGIPTYKLDGFVASFGAYKNHCSFFPGHTVRDFSEELKGYKILKGTIQFPHDKPLSEALVRAMVRARADENLVTRTESVVQ
ncbi:MAG TPA: DUF1801 domain-containing protein [Fimbriimonas sp.]|nr:DUF1801 domain-containing protein [Fimbriimonas sp.]